MVHELSANAVAANERMIPEAIAPPRAARNSNDCLALLMFPPMPLAFELQAKHLHRLVRNDNLKKNTMGMPPALKIALYVNGRQAQNDSVNRLS
jgi:hypothetical protein